METEVKESNSMWNKSGYDVLGQVEDHREMVYSAASYIQYSFHSVHTL